MKQGFAIIFLLLVLLSVGMVAYIGCKSHPALLVPRITVVNDLPENDFMYTIIDRFKERGFDMAPYGKHSFEKSDISFVARRNFHLPTTARGKAYLWLEESPVRTVIPAVNIDEKMYHKIFTYSKKLVDNKKYFYAPIPYDYEHLILPEQPQETDKTVLITMVANNYPISTPLDEYTERRKTVEYLFKKHPEDFHLYGSGWLGLRHKLTPEELSNFLLSYKGHIPKKSEAVKLAKFTITYENAKYDGYVSEKIFDAMAAGSVPVYLGAPDILDYVPQECFINREDFDSPAALYSHLKNMPDEEYQKYRLCGESYMHRKHHYNDYETVWGLLEKEMFEDSFVFRLRKKFYPARVLIDKFWVWQETYIKKLKAQFGTLENKKEKALRGCKYQTRSSRLRLNKK